jgi:hypothetical protein
MPERIDIDVFLRKALLVARQSWESAQFDDKETSLRATSRVVISKLVALERQGMRGLRY